MSRFLYDSLVNFFSVRRVIFSWRWIHISWIHIGLPKNIFSPLPVMISNWLFYSATFIEFLTMLSQNFAVTISSNISFHSIYGCNYIFYVAFWCIQTLFFSIWVQREKFSAILFIVIFHFIGTMIQFHIFMDSLNIANILLAGFSIIAFSSTSKNSTSIPECAHSSTLWFASFTSETCVACTENYINWRILERINEINQWKQYNHLNWFTL